MRCCSARNGALALDLTSLAALTAQKVGVRPDDGGSHHANLPFLGQPPISGSTRPRRWGFEQTVGVSITPTSHFWTNLQFLGPHGPEGGGSYRRWGSAPRQPPISGSARPRRWGFVQTVAVHATPTSHFWTNLPFLGPHGPEGGGSNRRWGSAPRQPPGDGPAQSQDADDSAGLKSSCESRIAHPRPAPTRLRAREPSHTSCRSRPRQARAPCDRPSAGPSIRCDPGPAPESPR